MVVVVAGGGNGSRDDGFSFFLSVFLLTFLCLAGGLYSLCCTLTAAAQTFALVLSSSSIFGDSLTG